MTEKEKLTESLINLLNETYKYNNKANGYIDDEKEIEYDLPEIPKNIQKEFLEKVNTWIKENK